MAGPYHIMADGKFPVQDGSPVLIDEETWLRCCCADVIWYCVTLAFWFGVDCSGAPDVSGPACVTWADIQAAGGIGACVDWGGYWGSYTTIHCGPFGAEADCYDAELCPECAP